MTAALLVAGLLVASAPARADTTGPAGRDGTTAATIPDGAFLQPEDLGGVSTGPAGAELRPYLRPPQPCAGPGGYPALGLRRASGAISAVYPVGDTRPTVLLEDLGVYRNDGAPRYLRQLRTKLTGRGCVDATGEWTILGSGGVVRESLLIRLRERIEDYDGNLVTRSTYLFVARVGSAVVVLADLGWELSGGREALVRDLAPAAVRRAQTLP